MQGRPAISQRWGQVLRRFCGVIRLAVGRMLHARPSPQRGMTLLELMFALVTLGILLSVGFAGYRQYVERARVSRAVADIGEIQLVLDKFELNRGVLPDSLAEIGFGAQLDPWGSAYQYLNIASVMGVGAVRKDRNLVPINTDFDLYSMGPDGESRPPLTARVSRDDIVRANDGRFIGKAEDY